MCIRDSYYVPYFNQKYSRSGTLWNGRYKTSLIDADEYFMLCSRYIEFNPVRNGLVGRAGGPERRAGQGGQRVPAVQPRRKKQGQSRAAFAARVINRGQSGVESRFLSTLAG